MATAGGATAARDPAQQHNDGRVMEPNYKVIQPYLIARGLSDDVACTVAFNHLRYWSINEAEEVFCRLDASPDEIRNGGLRNVSLPDMACEPDAFVKPPADLVRFAAKIKGALCVDTNGDFCVDPADGFAALSHVWRQGLQADGDGRGLRRGLLDQVFERIAPLGVRWLWVDSLAIPGGGQEMTAEEEALKAELINAMAGIYRSARWVVVLDALVMRLDSLDHVATAVVLCCGAWMTRVWTYQEIKLATSAVVATKAGFVGFADMVATLRVLRTTDREVYGSVRGNTLDDPSIGRYRWLHTTLSYLLPDAHRPVPSLARLALSCGSREARDRIDYARAVFPTLGLRWEQELGADLGLAMRRIYESAREQATALATFHGPPRARYPGWAPAVFPGLEGARFMKHGTWEARGMRREWCSAFVKGVSDGDDIDYVLELEDADGNKAECDCAVGADTWRDSPESVEVAEEAMSQGRAWLLVNEQLRPKPGLYMYGVLVERCPFVDEAPRREGCDEGWVCVTLAIRNVTATLSPERRSWLLMHENPTSEGGRRESEVAYLAERAAALDVAGETERS